MGENTIGSKEAYTQDTSNGRHRVALRRVSSFIIMVGFQDAASTDT